MLLPPLPVPVGSPPYIAGLLGLEKQTIIALCMTAVMYRTLMASTGTQARTELMRDTNDVPKLYGATRNADDELKVLKVPVS